MNPAPRPPSPGARDATQKALRRENPHQLSSRDARVLMGLPSPDLNVTNHNGERTRLENFFADGVVAETPTRGNYDAGGGARSSGGGYDGLSVASTPRSPGRVVSQASSVSGPPPTRPSREGRRASNATVCRFLIPTDILLIFYIFFSIFSKSPSMML
jgi:hypothetical protein